jgi:hypothetical protein
LEPYKQIKSGAKIRDIVMYILQKPKIIKEKNPFASLFTKRIYAIFA